jgi:hypothetical protein
VKKKKRRKRGYRRGIHVSPIAGECRYRSSWEEKYMNYLDNNLDVATWSYEKLVIEYVANKSTNKIRKYYPDFFVELRNGDRLLIEIKQKRKLQTLIVKKKTDAAKKWCSFNNAIFLILTEVELKEMGIL